MRGQTHIQKEQIRFNRWSRAGWAIFRSLSRVVNIGHVDMHIQEQALLKTSGINGLSLPSDHSDQNNTEKSEPSEGICTDLIPALIMLIMLVLTIQTDISYSGPGLFHLDNIITTITTGELLILPGIVSLYLLLSINLPDAFTRMYPKAIGMHIFPDNQSLTKQHFYDTRN